MTALVRTDGHSLAWLTTTGTSGQGLAPYAQEIRLLRCHVAGTSYRDVEPLVPTLTAGEVFTLRRQPANRHDARAVQVLRADGSDLGYLPREKNEVIASLLDAGKRVFARYVGVKAFEGWTRIDVDVVLDDR